MQLELDKCIQNKFIGEDRAVFDHWMSITGEVFRDMKTRRTLRFTHEGQGYFIKQHFGVGIKEVIKNLLCGRLAVIGAESEKIAVQHLKKNGILTMDVVGFGQEETKKLSRRSFIITKDLMQSHDLEQYCNMMQSSNDFKHIKKQLIMKLSHITRRMHESGMNHRDFYLCHFLIKDCDIGKLYLIDCHRAMCRKKVNRRWRIKDLAGLYFSAMKFKLSRHEMMRFIQGYTQLPPSKALVNQKAFWKAVEKKAIILKNKHKEG